MLCYSHIIGLESDGGVIWWVTNWRLEPVVFFEVYFMLIEHFEFMIYYKFIEMIIMEVYTKFIFNPTWSFSTSLSNHLIESPYMID